MYMFYTCHKSTLFCSVYIIKGSVISPNQQVSVRLTYWCCVRAPPVKLNDASLVASLVVMAMTLNRRTLSRPLTRHSPIMWVTVSVHLLRKGQCF